MVLAGWLAAFGSRADFHVSPDGSDANAGTREAPFASLEAARDAVRKARRESALPSGGITVWLRGGWYGRTNTLTFSEADSGAPGAPVVWRAAAGERVRIAGGVRLRGHRPVSDPAMRSRFEPSVRDRIREFDLPAPGWEVIPGGMRSRGFGRSTTPSHPELFHGGRPMVLARWPDEGAFETIAGFPVDGAEGDGHGGKIGKLENGFEYTGDRPKRWRETGEVWVHGYWAWDWANSYERVAEIDTAARRIRTAAPHGLYGFRKGQRFYFLNVPEELDQPGEWYLDRANGKVYFLPPPGPEAEAVLSVLDRPLVSLEGASHVVWQGVVFEATRASAVTIRDGASNRVAGCRIRNIGNHGVEIVGGTGHAVVGCDITDTGDGGVVLTGGDRKTLAPAGHLVEAVDFRRQGRWSKCYVPAILMEGVGMVARRNLIRDHPHCAILFGGNDHLIEGNEIHHVALETGDVGAIYAGRDYTYRGNRIRHNFIHHVGGVGMGSMGAYMDDCVSGTEIEGNLFYRVQRAAFLGGGRDHRVINNVFVECDHAVELDGRGLDRSPVWRGMVDDTMRKRLASVPTALYRERYPALKDLDRYYGTPGGGEIRGSEFSGVPPENNVVARNVCVGKWLRVGWHATREMLRLEANLADADPRFVGTIGEASRPADFALRPDSPAWALGHRRIPVESIGLPSADARRELPPEEDAGPKPSEGIR